MKQVLTIFRAEGAVARQMFRLCRTTRKDALPELRDAWRREVRAENSRFSAYVEYFDGWSMGDDFVRVLGAEAHRRSVPDGELYFQLVNDEMLERLRLFSRLRWQFSEQTEFVRIISNLAKGSGECDGPVALVVFRDCSPCRMQPRNGAGQA